MSGQECVLESPRLILRPPIAEDFEGFKAFHADARVMTYLGGPAGPAIAWRSMRYMAGLWQMDGFAMFSIIDKASGQWIGRGGPIRPYDWPGVEIGWGLLPQWWGRGLALEATAMAAEFAFTRLSLNRIVHTIDARNEESKRLATRLGSRCEGPVTLPAPYVDSVVDLWAQTREDWKENRQRFNFL